MSKYSRAERCSYWTLLGFYYFARFLGVANWQLNRQFAIVVPPKRANRWATVIWRIFITLTYWSVLPSMLRQNPMAQGFSFVSLFVTLQVSSVSIFSTILFIAQIRGKERVLTMLQRFLEVSRIVYQKTQSSRVFKEKFLLLIWLKIAVTMSGYLYELPTLLQLDNIFELASTLLGAYLWMSSLLVLDACFLGFLAIGQHYEDLGAYLGYMVEQMEELEVDAATGESLSKYQRMKRLCECADNLDECNAIYTELYSCAKQFNYIFQWQILFYIYYNFTVILLLQHQCIWLYIHTEHIDLLTFLVVLSKFANLTLLIMCVHDAVENSDLPNLLCLDVVCNGIDERWDLSVETFMCQRKVENLEIKVLGFFQLNNEFILVILSAIISYLFILIQFSLTSSGHSDNDSDSNNNNSSDGDDSGNMTRIAAVGV